MWVGLLLALQQSHVANSCDSTPEPTTAVAPHTARGEQDEEEEEEPQIRIPFPNRHTSVA